MTNPLPGNVGTGRVTGRLATFAKRSTGNVEGETPLSGVVTFTPQITKWVDTGMSPKTVYVSSPVPISLDANGSLGTGVDLVATDDADLNPTGFQYLVSFNLNGAKLDPILIRVPEGSTQDLADLIAGTAIGSSTSFVIVDNGDGTLTFTGTGVVNNSDGTITLTGTGITDNGDGTYTVVGT